MTQTEALHHAFADVDTVLRKTLFLSKDQKRSLEKKARAPFASRIISYYVGQKAGKVVGYAFFEKQIVRTKPTIMMVVITPDGKVQSVEVLAFYEPRDYLPAPGWFRRFHGKNLSPDLWPGRGVDAITGATLSVRAFSLMVRRALALFELIGDQAQ
ncbi:MAG: FMN-binding protein [candidate division KSB1 bacterium]|nr:FMN-binding protein [candidate division KSB1 bacterium]